jgi:hypothetical protein
MRRGKDFEVDREVYERARMCSADKNRESFYMAQEDQEKFFDESIRWGYGLYNCQVREENGKYICSYMTGDTCD